MVCAGPHQDGNRVSLLEKALPERDGIGGDSTDYLASSTDIDNFSELQRLGKVVELSSRELWFGHLYINPSFYCHKKDEAICKFWEKMHAVHIAISLGNKGLLMLLLSILPWAVVVFFSHFNVLSLNAISSFVSFTNILCHVINLYGKLVQY